jgi:ribonuclease P protein component
MQPMTRLRFPRSARLTRSGEFAEVRARGRSEQGRYMVCSVAEAASEEKKKGAGAEPTPARVGIITSRRVGGAIERNRVRRRLREIVRADRPRLRGGVWIVVIARRRAVEASFEDLRCEWRRLAKRHGLLLLDA